MAESVAKSILRALQASKKPMSSAELYEQLDTVDAKPACATICSQLLTAEKVSRAGEHGTYAYSITPAGAAFIGKKDGPDLDIGKEPRVPDKKTSAAKQTQAVQVNERKAQPSARLIRTTQPALMPTAGATGLSTIETLKSTQTLLVAAPNDDLIRLAATVIAAWPRPLDQMPPDLAFRLHQSFAAFGPEA